MHETGVGDRVAGAEGRLQLSGLGFALEWAMKRRLARRVDPCDALLLCCVGQEPVSGRSGRGAQVLRVADPW